MAMGVLALTWSSCLHHGDTNATLLMSQLPRWDASLEPFLSPLELRKNIERGLEMEKNERERNQVVREKETLNHEIALA